MRNRWASGLALVTALYSGDLAAQAAITECRAAMNTLQNTNQVQNVGTLVRGQCMQIYGGVWVNGAGVSKDTTCEEAWTALNASPAALAAGKEFVTRNCPQMYTNLGWRSGPAASPGIPACVTAINTLSAAGKTVQAGNALKNRCQQMFQNGWLLQLGSTAGTCEIIWNGLTTSNMLGPARELITHNCPWLYNNGYAVQGNPIQP